MSAPLYVLEEVGSTQDELHRLASDGAEEGTAVVARRQTAGRGSRGRTWASPEGGLWLSVLWRPHGGDEPQLLSLRAGLAAAHVLEQLGGLPAVQLKWPNDVMVGGRKAGGILCEARWLGGDLSWVAIGFGLNVRNAPPAEARTPASSLAEWRPDIEASALALPMAAALSRLRGGALLAPAELAEWRARDWLQGFRLTSPAIGVARGITASGELQVETAEGMRFVASGDTVVVDLA